MATGTKNSGIPPELMDELQAAADRTAEGIRVPEAAALARKETDRIREEVFRQHGVLDIGTPAIRELRDA